MNDIQQAELRQILSAHAARYPLMTPCDAVKLLYQNEFGGGHLIRDRERAMAFLQAEYESTPHDPSLPLFEDIGNGMVRVMLAALDGSAYPPEALMDDFVRSAALHTGTVEAFLQKLEVLRELTREGSLPFSAEALEGYLQEYTAAGCPMVSHSDIYRQTYRPAYRVVLRSEINRTPV